MSGAIIDAVGTRLLVVPLPSYMHGFGYREINVPFVTLHSADGHTATGFCYTLDLGAATVCEQVERVIAPALLGTAIDDWDRVSREVLASTRRLGATTIVAALSAVDIAVWDLRATVAGIPLATLLGGDDRPIPFYGSGRGGQHFSLDELIEHSRAYAAEGFVAVKLSVGTNAPIVDAERVAAVREALGPGTPLMVDASERLTLPQALDLGRRLDPLGLVWFEEPLLAEDVAGYRTLAAAVQTPIATGEHFQQLDTFARYLNETAVGYLQPDAALGGGVTRMLGVSALAETFHRPIAWHSLADLHVHLAAAAPATAYLEDFPILDAIIADPLRPVAGVAHVPRRSGHGIRWDHDAIDRFTASSAMVTKSDLNVTKGALR